MFMPNIKVNIQDKMKTEEMALRMFAALFKKKQAF